MQTKWILEIKTDGSTAVFILSYENGRFKKLEKKSGQLANNKQHNSLMHLVPQLEKAIEILIMEYKDKPIEWHMLDPKDSSTVLKRLLDIYTNWYNDVTGIPAVINGVQINSLKKIVTSIARMTASEDELIATWELILNNWNKQTDFYRSQMELRQINSNINIILRSIKNEKAENNLRDKF